MHLALQRFVNLPLFASLHSRPFRWYWLGRIAASATMQMGSVAQGWLVYHLTGSGLALSMVSSAGGIATLIISPFAGVLSDRIDKRTLLVLSRIGMVLQAATLVALIATDRIQIWHIAALSLLSGILMAFMMPAQNAYLSELVGADTLMNAVSLTSVGMGLMGILGAPLAGSLIEVVGVEWVYVFIGVMYILAVYALWHLPSSEVRASTRESVWRQIGGGLRYVRLCPTLIPLLGFVVLRVILARPYITLMPKYAKDVFGLDAVGLGILTAAPSVGSLVSSFGMAALGQFEGKGRLLIGAGILLGVSMLAFANVSVFWVVVIVLAIAGAMQNITMVTNQTLVQVQCEAQYRGRVMSMYMFIWGLMPLGDIPAGLLADRTDVSTVVNLQGGILLALCLAYWFFMPKIRRLA